MAETSGLKIGRGMIPQAMAKTEQLATMATAGGGITILAAFNEWTGEYAPLITFVFGLVAMLTGIGTLAYKIWSGRAVREQRKRDRELEHKRMDHDRFMMGVRDDDRH